MSEPMGASNKDSTSERRRDGGQTDGGSLLECLVGRRGSSSSSISTAKAERWRCGAEKAIFDSRTEAGDELDDVKGINVE
jgi:hypothetical protein